MQAYRMSKSYVGAKLKAYGLMRVYLEKEHKQGKEIKDTTSKWSWFEEFYKKCMVQKKGETGRADRIYDGANLESKFVDWMLNDQLPRAEDVRRLYDCLKDKRAIAILDEGAGSKRPITRRQRTGRSCNRSSGRASRASCNIFEKNWRSGGLNPFKPKLKNFW